MDYQFKLMINDVKEFKCRDYVVRDGKIGYKELDGIAFNSVYGYQTMFLYMYEFDRANMTQ